MPTVTAPPASSCAAWPIFNRAGTRKRNGFRSSIKPWVPWAKTTAAQKTTWEPATRLGSHVAMWGILCKSIDADQQSVSSFSIDELQQLVLTFSILHKAFCVFSTRLSAFLHILHKLCGLHHNTRRTPDSINHIHAFPTFPSSIDRAKNTALLPARWRSLGGFPIADVLIFRMYVPGRSVAEHGYTWFCRRKCRYTAPNRIRCFGRLPPPWG